MRNYFIVTTVFAASVGHLMLFSPPVAAQDNSSNTVVLTEMMSAVLKWGSGTLTGIATDRNGHKTSVRVNFKVQNHHLSRLSITTASSTLDVSRYVEQLDMPFIGRLALIVAPSPPVEVMRIMLPYIDPSKEIGKQCMSFEILTHGSKVESAKGISDDSKNRCEP